MRFINTMYPTSLQLGRIATLIFCHWLFHFCIIFQIGKKPQFDPYQDLEVDGVEEVTPADQRQAVIDRAENPQPLITWLPT